MFRILSQYFELFYSIFLLISCLFCMPCVECIGRPHNKIFPGKCMVLNDRSSKIDDAKLSWTVSANKPRRAGRMLSETLWYECIFHMGPIVFSRENIKVLRGNLFVVFSMKFIFCVYSNYYISLDSKHWFHAYLIFSPIWISILVSFYKHTVDQGWCSCFYFKRRVYVDHSMIWYDINMHVSWTWFYYIN